MEPNDDKPSSRKKQIVIVGVTIIGMSIAWSVYTFFLDKANNYEECAAKKSSKIVSANDSIKCTYKDKSYTKNFPKSDNEYKTYKDDTLSFQYPADWKVQNTNGAIDEGGATDGSIYSITISSNKISGVLKSNSGANSFISLITINIYKPGSSSAVCNGCEAKSAQEISLTKPSGSVWQLFSQDNNLGTPPIVMMLNSDKIEAGSKDHAAAIKLPNGNLLVVKELVSTYFGGNSSDIKNLRPLYDLDDFVNAPSYLMSQSVLRSLAVN